MEFVRLFHGRRVAFAFGREDVEKDGFVLRLEEFEGAFEQGGVVPVDRTVVAEPEVLKDDAGEEHVLHPGLDFVGEIERSLSADGSDEFGGLVVEVGVGGIGRDLAEVAGHRTDIFRDGPFVVIEDDNEALGRFGHVVEGFEADAAGKSGIAGDHHHVFVGPAEVAGRGHAEAGGESGAGVACAVAVVLAFGTEEETVEAAVLADGLETFAPAGEHFVDVALVADVKEEFVFGGVEGAVEGDGQFDHPEVWAEVAAGFGDRPDEFIANFLGEKREVFFRHGADIGGAVDPGEDGCFKFLHRRRILPEPHCRPSCWQ